MKHSLLASFHRLALQPHISAASTSRSVVTLAQPGRLSLPRVRPTLQPLAHELSSSSRHVRARSYATEAPSSFSLGHFSPAQKKKQKKRLGRGSSSGRGGTSGRGHKGQKARAGNGKPTPGFEGGQTPIMKRFPKRGFVNAFARRIAPLNIDRLQDWIDQGRIDPSKPITAKELLYSRCVHQLKDGVKLLGNGAEKLRQPVDVVVSQASVSAIKAVESVGGSITCKYYTPLSLRALVKPEKWLDKGKMLPNEPLPIAKRDLLYYSDIRKRGYLAKIYLSGNLSLPVKKVRGTAEKATADVQEEVGADVQAVAAEVQEVAAEVQDAAAATKV